MTLNDSLVCATARTTKSSAEHEPHMTYTTMSKSNAPFNFQVGDNDSCKVSCRYPYSGLVVFVA